MVLNVKKLSPSGTQNFGTFTDVLNMPLMFWSRKPVYLNTRSIPRSAKSPSITNSFAFFVPIFF